MKTQCWRMAVYVAAIFSFGLVACGSYVTTVQRAEDEMIVKLVTDRAAMYDHPVRFTPKELATILEHVQVEYKAGWLQNLLTSPQKPLPLFEPQWLERIVPALVRGFEQAKPQDRIVFYVAQRRSDVRREVTGGSLFVLGRLMHIVVSNFRNGVDVVPGVPTYDRANPEIAVAPQRFTLTFKSPEFIVRRESGLVQGVFGAVPPSLVIDYWLFLNNVGHQAALGSSPGSPAPRP